MSKAKLRITALLCAACLLLGGCGAEDGAAEETAPLEGESTGAVITEAKAADNVFSVNCDPEKSMNPIRAESSTNMQLWSSCC